MLKKRGHPGVGCVTTNKRSDFGIDPDRDSEPGIFRRIVTGLQCCNASSGGMDMSWRLSSRQNFLRQYVYGEIRNSGRELSTRVCRDCFLWRALCIYACITIRKSVQKSNAINGNLFLMYKLTQTVRYTIVDTRRVKMNKILCLSKEIYESVTV